MDREVAHEPSALPEDLPTFGDCWEIKDLVLRI